MFFLRLRNLRKSRKIAEKDNELSKKLISEGNEHLLKLREIDQKLQAIQTSTKTSFSFFAPMHDYCRTKYNWYYNWHVKPYATKVHLGAMILVLFFCMSASYFSFFGNTEKVKAADYTCAWNGTTGSWSDTTKWTNCNGEYPGQTAGTSYDVSIPSGSVTLDVNNKTLNNVGNTVIGNITIGGTLTTNNNNLTFGSMSITGTVTAGSSTLIAYGSWDSSAGTFTYNTSVVKFASTSSGKTIKPKAATTTFYDLTFDGVGGVWTTLANALTVARNLTITNGTFDPSSLALSVTGAFSNSGNFGISATKPSGVHTFSSTWTNTAGATYYLSSNAATTTFNGNITCAGTLNATSNGSITISGTTATIDFTNGNFAKGTGVLKFYRTGIGTSVTFNPGASGNDFGAIQVLSATSMGSLNVIVSTNDLTATSVSLGSAGGPYAGNLNISNRTLTMTGIGSPLTIFDGSYPGSLTTTGSTVRYTGAGGTAIALIKTMGSTPITYNNLEILPGANNVTHTIGTASSQSLSCSGYLTLGNGANTGAIIANNSYNNTMLISGAFTINSNTTFNASATASFNISGDYTNNGTFAHNNGTITFNKGSSTQTLNSGGTGSGKTFYNLLHSSGGSLQLSGNALKVDNTFTNSSGAFNNNSQSVTINGAANSSGGNTTLAGATIDFNNSYTIYGGAFASLSNSVVTVAGSLNAGGSGTLTTAPNSLTFDGASGGSFDPGAPYYNSVNISGSGTWSLQRAFTNFSAVSISSGMLSAGSYSFGSSSSGSSSISISNTGVFLGGSQTIYPGNSLSVTGGALSVGSGGVTLGYNGGGGSLYTHSGGTVDWVTNSAPFSWYSGSQSVNIPADNYYAVSLDGYGGFRTFNMTGTTTINNNLTIGLNAALSTQNNNINIYGNWVNNGMFSAGEGTVDFKKTSGTQTLSSNSEEVAAFYNIIHSGTATLQLVAGPIDINGSLTNMAGIFDANNLNMRVGGDWNFSDLLFRAKNGGTATDQTVTFNATSETVISGSNTFNNLTFDSSAGAKIVKITAGSTQNIPDGKTLSLSGANQDNRITYQSTSDGMGENDQYTFSISEQMSGMRYINVQDFNATQLMTPDAANCTDNGNNSNWLFNQAPGMASGIDQLYADGNYAGQSIPADGYISSHSVTFIGWPNDPDPRDYVRLCVELKPFGTPFSDSDDACGGSVSLGSEASVTMNDIAEGSYHWQIREIDAAGLTGGWYALNSNGGATKDFAVDNTPPTTDIYLNPTNPSGTNSYYKASAPQVTFSANDGSGVGNPEIYFRWGVNGGFTQYSTATTAPEGINTIYYYGVDDLQNASSTFSRQVKVDTLTPAISATANPLGPNGSNSYFIGTAPAITLSADDFSGSGVSSIKYKWGNGSFADYTAPLTAPEGTNMLYFYGIDSAGNSGVSTPASAQYKVQTTTPDVSLAANPVNPNGTNTYYKTAAPTVHLSASDPNSGVSAIKYHWGSDSDQIFSSDITAPEGTNTLTYYSVSNSGVQSTHYTQDFKVDTSLPTADIYSTPASANGTNDYFKSNVIITLGATDNSSSGIFHIYYHFDSNSDSVYTSGVDAPEGIHTIYYHSADNAGNTTATFSRQFKVDTISPSVNITANPASSNGGSGYYSGAAPAITLSGVDNSGSGSSSIKYRFGNSGSYLDYSDPIIAPEGTSTLYTYAIDNAGNSSISSPDQNQFKVDTTAPSVLAVSLPSSPNGANGWYKGNAPKITLSQTDASSGGDTINFKWDNGQYSTYSEPVIASEGIHTISYYGIDRAGNQAEASTLQIKYDKTDSTASATISPETPDRGQFYKETAPVITLSGSDALSGFASIKYRWDNDSWQDYLTPIASAEGIHTLSYYSIDNAGNDASSSPMALEIKYDKTAPDLSSITPLPSATPTNNLSVAFNWPAPSDVSGIDHYLIYIGSKENESDILDGQSVATNTLTQLFETTGEYYIRIKAIDLAGNLSDFSKEGTVTIEKELPDLSVSELQSDQYITSKTYRIKGTSSDILSGISKVELKFDSNDYLVASSEDAFKSWTYDWSGYSEGVHTILAKATDKAGNEKASASYSVIVDTTAPSIPSDLRVFNISNKPANTFASYLDFASSSDETSQVKTYEVYRDNTKLSEISPVEDSSNPSYTGNKNQPFYLVDKDLKEQSYSYKIKAIDNAGNSSESAPVTIDTTGKQIENDSISEVKSYPSSVVTKESTSATISWKTTYPATSQVQYGESTSYGKTTDLDENLNQGHSVLLKDLKPNTTYHAKATSKDIYGRETTSEDITFTTKSPEDSQSVIKVIIDTLQSLLKSLRIQAADTSNTSSVDLSSLQETSDNLLLTDISFKDKGLYQNILTFAKNSKVEKSTDNQSFTSLTSDNGYYLDKDLNTDTNYYYRLDNGKALSRKPAIGDESPLAVTDQSVIKESVLASKDKVQLTVFWKTNRGSSSQVDFGSTTSYGKKTKEDLSLNTGHNIIIEDLDPDTTYHFKVTSTDSKGNVSVSGDFTYKTPAAQKEKGPFDVILETLQRAFSFFKF